ncbi:macrophage colony-stimulating factor 1a [Pangasianodon hypophthalmus]|uniref:macrophage colony-stimulating factor 1a n=1 Tax=Pangasianodon hypophthalmus TaxID=310915 RepID=UPI0023080926|nr:macrophage colony-stimulating factor 1a [Pangasianodon hypophthalmus]XP_026791071.3 macrophage colony-stimulating factor 1a [Pangasianodon hypophthalmus]
MNTHTTAHKAKIRHLCSCLVLCLHLVSGAVPGPCGHSVTEEHLLTLRKLIINQVQNGCSITYSFTEHQNLSEVCHIKAAFPHILDLLNTHFTYEKGSDNYRYTSSLKDLIYHIYSQKCIPPINEEIEENPVKFARLYTSLPREGLQKTEEVFQMYKRLMSTSDKPVNWNCEDEYANNVPESTTALYPQATGTPECQCSCPDPMKAFMFTRSIPTASPSSLHTQSGAYIFRNKNEASSAPDPAVKDEAPNSTQNQISAISQTSTNFITFTTRNLMDNSSDSSVPMRSEPQSVTSSPIASSSELPSIPTRAPLQSATSQPSEKINTPLISDSNPVLVLAKRSLDTREQGMLSDSFSKLLQRWITETVGLKKNKMVKPLEITPGETENPPVEHVEQNSPTHLQMHLHKAKSLPGNVFKIISNEPDCKDSRCQTVTEDRSEQRPRDRVKRHSVEKEYQLIHSSLYTTFLITSVCLLLLFITVLFYCKQQRIKDLQKEDRTIHF